MKSVYDVMQLLKKFGVFVYTGDRIGDLEMIEMEVRGLYQSSMIDIKVFQTAILIIKSEIKRLNNG